MDRGTALLYVGSAMVVLVALQYALKAMTHPTPATHEKPHGGLPGLGPPSAAGPSQPATSS